MASLVVLGAYAALGLLDSLHFRPALEQRADAPSAYSSEVLSVLDLGLARLRATSEKTYSAPLATRSYAKELIERPDGRQLRDFPRLQFGGAQLQDEADWAGDVAKRALGGLAVSVLLCLAVWLCTRVLKKNRPDIPWQAAG